MFSKKNRLDRERATMAAMLAIYCKAHHAGTGKTLCEDCAALLEYAGQRLANCPFGEEKPACNLCTVHCYGRSPREQVRQVMRYSGPRMLLRHPLLAILHLLDERRPAPDIRSNRLRD